MDRKKYLSIDEITRLREHCELMARKDLEHGRKSGPLTWMVVDLALSTGLRVSEIAALKVSDFDPNKCILTVTRMKKRRKTGRITDGLPEWEPVRKPESLAISDGKGELCDHLKEFIQWRELCGIYHERLLVGNRGPLSAQGLQIIWKKAVMATGMVVKDKYGQAHAEYSIHAARHSNATHLLAKTKNLRLVQKALGHASPVITANMYADVTDEELRSGARGMYKPITGTDEPR